MAGRAPPRPDLSALNVLKGDQGLLLRQNVSWQDVIYDADVTANKYQVKPIPEDHAEDDGLISADEFAALPTRLVALEQSGACARAFWGPLRPFEMALRDGAGRELFRVHRELRFPPLLFCGCFPCCGCFVAPQHAEVLAPDGFKIGSVTESHHNCQCVPASWYMDINDEQDQLVFVARAHVHQCGAPNCWPCFRSYTFEILTPELEPTGAHIRNRFPGCTCAGMFGRADFMEVTFPPTATAEQRALLVSATLLADYTYFQKVHHPAGNSQLKTA